MDRTLDGTLRGAHGSWGLYLFQKLRIAGSVTSECPDFGPSYSVFLFSFLPCARSLQISFSRQAPVPSARTSDAGPFNSLESYGSCLGLRDHWRSLS